MKAAGVQFASISGDIVVAVGVPLATSGRPYLAMLIFRPRAPVVVHAKRWLHDDEVPWFSAGDAPTVLDLDRERLAPAICFEALQREHVGAVVALGATTYLASVAKHARGVDEAHEFLAAVADVIDRLGAGSVTLDAADLVLDPAGLNYVLPVQIVGINDMTGTGLAAVQGTAITVIDN